MKPFLHHLIPQFLRPPWHRSHPLAPKPPEPDGEPMREPRYIPMWGSGQIFPILMDVEKSKRRRDPFD